jgi:predicted nucleic acid-binding protein
LSQRQKLRARGKLRSAVDPLIAAAARSHNLTLVTRNVRNFTDTGVVVYDA